MNWLRNLVGLALVSAAAFGLMYWMGSRVPVEHRAIASEVIEASQDRVWELVSDTATHPTWRTGLVSVKPIEQKDLEGPEDNRCWVEWHRSLKLTFCLVEEQPKSRRVVRIAGKNAGFSGTWTYALRPVTAHTTEITITEDGTVRPPLWRFLGYYFMGEDTNVKIFLRDLQAEAIRKR